MENWIFLYAQQKLIWEQFKSSTIKQCKLKRSHSHTSKNLFFQEEKQLHVVLKTWTMKYAN